mgnify:CR=1 FL=1
MTDMNAVSFTAAAEGKQRREKPATEEDFFTDCKENYTFEDLCAVVERLRAEDGCPWDHAQTHDSLRRYLMEETYEVLEAIDQNDPEGMKEELGDLLLQILFHASIEEEKGHFTLRDVVREETDKMIRRHPHVFGQADAQKTLAAWEDAKSLEKKRKTLSERLGSIPRNLPALLRAQKYTEKLHNEKNLPKDLCPFAAPLSIPPPEAPVNEETAGKFLLFAVSFFAGAGIDCEAALSRACDALSDRAKKSESLKKPRITPDK